MKWKEAFIERQGNDLWEKITSGIFSKLIDLLAKIESQQGNSI